MPITKEEFLADLKAFIEEKLPKLLINESRETHDPWKIPVVDDFILIAAVQDFADGNGNVVAFPSDSPAYRIRGLLTETLA